MSNREFEIGDVIEVSGGELVEVNAVIHDDEKVWAYNSAGDDIEYAFDEVINQWRKVD